VGKRLIGRYEVTSAGFSPGFKVIMIWAILRGRGQYSSLSMALNMYKSLICSFVGSCCSITAVMLSWPGAFLSFRATIACCIAFKLKRFGSCGPCSFRNESTSYTWLLL
jgi:hypothetical protein